MLGAMCLSVCFAIRSRMALFFTDYPPVGRRSPCWGPGGMWSSGGAGMAELVARSTVSRCVVGSSPRGAEHFGFPPVLCDWVIKGLGVYRRVYVTGHIKDPGPFIEKRRGLSPGVRFPPSFIHQLISGVFRFFPPDPPPRHGNSMITWKFD